MTLPETYRSQVQHIQESPKFQPQPPKGGRKAVFFPGYTVITPPAANDTENSSFYQKLKGYQQHLQERLDPGFLIPVPPDSFHLTLADLIWASAYLHAAENAEFEDQLRDRIAQSFRKYQYSNSETSPIRFRTIGLIVMTRAVAIGLAPADESAYEQIIRLRRAIYQNSDLMALGIEQQYHFTPHVTLGYFGEISESLDRDRLGQTFAELNQQWLEEEAQELRVQQAELCKFDDMTRYYREPDWPLLKF